MKYDASEPGDIITTVTTLRTTTITADPALVNEHREPLSNLDLIMPKEDVDVILCYEKPNIAFDIMVTTLKKSLAETLVEYYVFAGELVCNDSSGELEILCNNRGVDFVEATVDLQLCELDLYKPHEVLGGKLTPKKKNGNFSVQVMEFVRCGSIVMSCKFDHRVADAYSANLFFVAWSENSRSKPISLPPCRLIFHPRSPLLHGADVERFYSPISSLPPPFILRKQSSIGRLYYVKAEKTIALQAAASNECSTRTKLESFCAFLWQLLAQSASVNNKREELITKMSVVVDGRARLASVYEYQSCISYFGNAISGPYGSETLETIRHKPLTWVGEKVAEFIKAGANTDHFLDLIDFIETNRPDKTIPTNFWPRSTDGPKMGISSGLRLSFGDIDFGWGSPLLGFFCLPWEADFGYVMPVQLPNGNGDWLVYMYLPTDQVEFIEKVAPHVFEPFSLDLVPR